MRRLNAVIPFPIPAVSERYELWRRAVLSPSAVTEDVDWHDSATRHELGGADIRNVTLSCVLDASARQTQRVDLKTIETAIEHEMRKKAAAQKVTTKIGH